MNLIFTKKNTFSIFKSRFFHTLGHEKMTWKAKYSSREISAQRFLEMVSGSVSFVGKRWLWVSHIAQTWTLARQKKFIACLPHTGCVTVATGKSQGIVSIGYFAFIAHASSASNECTGTKTNFMNLKFERWGILEEKLLSNRICKHFSHLQSQYVLYSKHDIEYPC